MVSQLCIAEQVNSHDVFFFQPYRDDTIPQVDKRMSAWAKNIKEYIQTEINRDLARGGFRPAKDQTRVEFQPNTASLLNVQGLANELVVSGAAWILDDLEAAIKNMDAELKDGNVSHLVALHRLLDIRDDFPDNVVGHCVDAMKV